MRKFEWSNKKVRKLQSFLAVGLGLIIVYYGGGKLLVYLGLLITGLIVGWQAKKYKGFYDDYKLGLKINSLQYATKQFEALQAENKALKEEIESASARLQLANSRRSVGGGDFSHDHFNHNGFTRVREDA